MSNADTKQQQIKNEQTTRRINRKVKEGIKHHVPAEEVDRLKLDFYCECADADCPTRLAMTIKEYETLHQDKSHFAIAKGHEAPTIENVIKTKKNLQVVEKHDL